MNTSAFGLPALPARPGPSLYAAFLVAYVGLDGVSFIDPVGPLGITPWNPAPGLALFLLLRYGWRFSAWLFVAVLAAELIVRGAPAPWPVLLLIAALLTGCYTLLASVLRKQLGLHQRFCTLRDATMFLVAVTAATAIIALLYVSAFAAGGALPAGNFAHSVAQYWVGDLIGIVVTTPLLMVVTRSAEPGLKRAPLEIAAQLLVILAALWIVFESGIGEELRLFYLLFLPLIWVSMRHGVAGSTSAALLMQIGVIAALLFGGHVPGTILHFQVLLLALASTGLVLGTAVDERLAAERRLRDKQAELDRSMRAAAASELASVLAHELNQPLSAVATYAGACRILLEDGDPAGELSATLRKVVAEANRAGLVMRRLREFVLTGSVRCENIAPSSLLASAVNAATSRATTHGIVLSVDVAPGVPDAQCDRVQIETVLHNLVMNAIDASRDFNGRRSIKLSARYDDANFLRVCVADDGPGILPEIAVTLFKPLTSSKTQGLGLGLSISRTIIEAHGGRLWLEPSTVGAAFCFTLPVATDAHD